MDKKTYTIHLLGHDIEVKMNMSVLIAYEDITGTSFYGETFETTKTRYALLAAIVAVSDAPKAKDMADLLLTDVTPKEFNAAFEVAMQALEDFFEIPKVLKKDEPEQEGEKEKNS